MVRIGFVLWLHTIYDSNMRFAYNWNHLPVVVMSTRGVCCSWCEVQSTLQRPHFSANVHVPYYARLIYVAPINMKWTVVHPDDVMSWSHFRIQRLLPEVIVSVSIIIVGAVNGLSVVSVVNSSRGGGSAAIKSKQGGTSINHPGCVMWWHSTAAH